MKVRSRVDGIASRAPPRRFTVMRPENSNGSGRLPRRTTYRWARISGDQSLASKSGSAEDNSQHGTISGTLHRIAAWEVMKCSKFPEY